MPVDHLPLRLRPIAERVRDFALTDATVLIILGVGCIGRGASYWSHLGPAPHQHPAEAWLDMDIWSLVWMIVGAVCIIAVPWFRSITAALAVAAGMSLHLLWGFSFLWNTLHGDSPRGWVSSIGYFMISALVAWSVWRGSRTEIRIREGAAHDRRDDCHRGH